MATRRTYPFGWQSYPLPPDYQFRSELDHRGIFLVLAYKKLAVSFFTAELDMDSGSEFTLVYPSESGGAHEERYDTLDDAVTVALARHRLGV